MKQHFKDKTNERILTFINRWFKHGAIVQKTWSFLAKAELEKMISESYEQGRSDERNDIELEQAIQKIL